MPKDTDYPKHDLGHGMVAHVLLFTDSSSSHRAGGTFCVYTLYSPRGTVVSRFFPMPFRSNTSNVGQGQAKIDIAKVSMEFASVIFAQPEVNKSRPVKNGKTRVWKGI